MHPFRPEERAMTTVHLTAFDRLLGRRRREVPRRRAALPSWFGPPDAGPVDDDAAMRVAGWFESSAELRRGLAVVEDPDADAWPTVWSAPADAVSAGP
jgi:hypothetical protein